MIIFNTSVNINSFSYRYFNYNQYLLIAKFLTWRDGKSLRQIIDAIRLLNIELDLVSQILCNYRIITMTESSLDAHDKLNPYFLQC